MQFTFYYTEGEPQVIKVPMTNAEPDDGNGDEPTNPDDGDGNDPVNPDGGDGNEPTNPDDGEDDEPTTPEGTPLTDEMRQSTYDTYSAQWNEIDMTGLDQEIMEEYEFKSIELFARINKATTEEELVEITTEFDRMIEEIWNLIG